MPHFVLNRDEWEWGMTGWPALPSLTRNTGICGSVESVLSEK